MRNEKVFFDGFGVRWGEDRDDADNRYVDGRIYPRWASSGPVRSREEYPYSYSAFISHGPKQRFQGDDIDGCYSDRLRTWHPEEWSQAWGKMPSNHFAQLSLKNLSDFLSQCFGKRVECLQVLEGCNVSNGYPYWYFVYRRLAA